MCPGRKEARAVGEFYDRSGKPMTRDEWARAFEDSVGRIVAKSRLGDVEVSTVWLGLDHSFGAGPPLIFETMIFGGARDQEQYRYATEDEALAGHLRIASELGAAHA
jgi:hypothetical protein